MEETYQDKINDFKMAIKSCKWDNEFKKDLQEKLQLFKQVRKLTLEEVKAVLDNEIKDIITQLHNSYGKERTSYFLKEPKSHSMIAGISSYWRLMKIKQALNLKTGVEDE